MRRRTSRHVRYESCERERPEKKEGKLTVSNVQLAFLISIWFAFTQIRDMIAKNTLEESQRASNTEAIVRYGKDIDELTKDDGTIDRLETIISSLSGEIDAMRIEIKSTRDLSYEYNSTVSKDLNRIEANLEALKASVSKSVPDAAR